MAKPKGLGRGLEALLGPRLDDTVVTPDTSDTPSQLSLDDLVPGTYQPRTRMDEGALYELAQSIKAQGIMQPILVRPLDAEAGVQRWQAWQAQLGLPATERGARKVYEIIAGERRFRAARLAGLDTVPVLVREVPNESAAAMALIENIQREDLNPLEEAHGLQRLVQEFGLTHEQAAQSVGRSRSAASNLLRLLQLAEPVQTMLMAGDIDMGHARALLPLAPAQQITSAHEIAAKQLSVRDAETLVKRVLNPAPQAPAPAAAQADGDVRRVEEQLSDALGATVQIRIKKHVKRHGKAEPVGEVAIAFASLDALNGLIERLQAQTA